MCDTVERGMEFKEFIMNYTMNDYVSRKVVGKEGVSYHIQLIINLESNL